MKISIVERIVLAEIVSLDSIGDCFASNSHFGELLSCSESNARKTIYKLISRGLILRVSKNEHGDRLLCPNPDAGDVQNWTLGVSKSDHIYIQPTKQPINSKGAKPKNLEMVVEAFLELGMETEAEAFFDYYESNGWVQGKARTPIKNWRATARAWIRRQKQFSDEKQKNGRGFHTSGFDSNRLREWADRKNNVGDI